MTSELAPTPSPTRVCLAPGGQSREDKKMVPLRAKRPTLSAKRQALNAQRQVLYHLPIAKGTLTHKPYGIASCTPARLHVARSLNHNSHESFTLATVAYQPSHPALQAALEPMNENAPCENRLIDRSSHAQNPQNRLLGAFNGMLYALVSIHKPTIHKYQLSIISHDFWPAPSLERTEHLCRWTHIIKQKSVRSSHLRVTHPKWVEKEKMTIFSLFNHENKKPWIGQKVNRRFLARALRKSGIDFLNDLWHAMAVNLGGLLSLSALNQGGVL